MVLSKLPVPGRPLTLITVGKGPTALAVGADGVWTFSLSSMISLFFLPLWETARYRLKYCLKGHLSPKQPTNRAEWLELSLISDFLSETIAPNNLRLVLIQEGQFSYWRNYVHEVLVNRLGGLSLPRKSVVRLTDRPDMTLDVYRENKTTTQQQE